MKMFKTLVGLLVVLGLGVSGCLQQTGSFQFSGPVDAPMSLTRETMSRIRLTEYDIARYPSVEHALWAEGARVGMRKVFNEFLQLEPVFRPSELSGACPGGGAQTRRGVLASEPDPVTGDYIQKFQVAARFTPARECSGRILALEKDRFLAGSGDRFTAVLYGDLPGENGGYFLVARQLEESENRIMQVVGSGRVVRTLGASGQGVSLPESVPGTLCQAELWETNREVEQGDAIFFLSTSMTGVRSPGPTVRASDGEYPEVVVEPRQEPVYNEPTEDK